MRWDGQKRPWDGRDSDAYAEDEYDYGLLIRTVVAAIIFTIIYIAHISGSIVGKWVDYGVEKVLTSEIDFGYLKENSQKLYGELISQPFVQKVQTVVSRTADPLQYMLKPAEGKLVTAFGKSAANNIETEGIEIEVVAGSPIKAVAAGRVKTASDSEKWGKVVIIEHGNDVETLYGRLGDVYVKAEDIVSQGQVIALVNKQGIKAPSKLYFELKVKGKSVDPLSRIK